jgi:hypothetical protein
LGLDPRERVHGHLSFQLKYFTAKRAKTAKGHRISEDPGDSPVQNFPEPLSEFPIRGPKIPGVSLRALRPLRFKCNVWIRSGVRPTPVRPAPCRGGIKPRPPAIVQQNVRTMHGASVHPKNFTAKVAENAKGKHASANPSRMTVQNLRDPPGCRHPRPRNIRGFSACFASFAVQLHYLGF